jgi:hypothetical protein
MASKYVNKDFFAAFKKAAQEEKIDTGEKKSNGASHKFPNPQVNQEYKIRFLPDASGQHFYKKFYYHMMDIDGNWSFSICPKTFDMDSYCPLCALAAKLYKSGTQSDKNEAGRWKRKEKFVANIFVVNDPRDADKDEEAKMSGKVKIFEFRTKLENNVRVGIFDAENGVGPAGFDPTDEGINFVIRVTETKPQADGKKWPDYATSSFARNASAIADTDKEVDEVMKQTVDLNEYLKKQLQDEEKIVEIIKDEQMFDLIAEEYSRILNKRNPKKQILNDEAKVASKSKPRVDEDEDADEKIEHSSLNEEEEKAHSKKPTKKSGETELDEDLLAELNKM